VSHNRGVYGASSGRRVNLHRHRGNHSAQGPVCLEWPSLLGQVPSGDRSVASTKWSQGREAPQGMDRGRDHRHLDARLAREGQRAGQGALF
jgi:hypothetical protein